MLGWSHHSHGWSHHSHGKTRQKTKSQQEVPVMGEKTKTKPERKKRKVQLPIKKIEGNAWCFHRSFNVYVSVSVIGFFEVEHARVFCAGVGAGQRSRVPSKRPCVGAHVDFFAFTMREGHPRGHLPGDTLLQPVGPGNWTEGEKNKAAYP